MANTPSNFNAATQPSTRKNDDPLGPLDTSQYDYASFIYPMDLGAPGAGKDHYMIFHINETSTKNFITADGKVVPSDPPTIVKNESKDTAAGYGTGGMYSIKDLDGAGTATTGSNGGQLNANELSAQKIGIRRIRSTIVLYMPNELTTSYQAHWEAEELGLASDVVKGVQQTGSWSDVLSSGFVSTLKQAGVSLNNLTDMNLQSAISLASRMAINNHQEVIFNGIGFRQFTFNFRFTPQSEAEALNVDNIIRAFKFYAAPDVLGSFGGRFWIYPAEFDIQYISNGKENEFLNRISTCALVDIQVNYTPTGHWAAHRPHNVIPGQPSVCTDISLTFKELEIMTKRRVLEGY